MDVQRFLAGNLAVGIALAAVLAGVGYANRSFVRGMRRDPEAGWRLLAGVALGLSGLFIVWVSVADNWRQLIGLPYRLSQRFPSHRVEIDPTPEALRIVTGVLLVASLVTVACLFARHVGGYGLQLVLLLGCLIFWAPLFAVRQRFDLGLALTDDVAALRDVPGYMIYLLLTWFLDIAVTMLSYCLLLMAVALPITLLLDLTNRRCPPTTGDATAFFAALGDQSTAGRDQTRVTSRR